MIIPHVAKLFSGFFIPPCNIGRMRANQLLDKFPVISDQVTKPRLEVVLAELEKVLEGNPEGDIVEFGCYIGTTSLFIRRLLNEYHGGKEFHVYDSFEGLPEKVAQDNSPVGADFKAGELTVSKKQLLEQFHKARLQPPKVHKGWFKNLTTEEVPDTIAFAFLDGDFYESIIDSLRLVWPRMQPGGIITVDDCGREALPGVDRALRDFFQDKQITLRVRHNIGIIELQ
jgi:O-methyltransferase